MSTPIIYRTELMDRYRLVYDWVPDGTGSVLDIGCGNGVFTQWLCHKAGSVTGADHSRRQIEFGAREFRAVEFVCAPGEQLPFADATFDVVVMSEVLEHMDDDRAAVDEALRVLRAGGMFVITVPNRGAFAFLDGDNVVNRFVWLLSKLRIPKGRHDDGTRRTFYEGFRFVKHRHYSLRQLRELVGERAELEQVAYGGLLLWPLTYLVEKVLEVFFRRPLVTARYAFLRRLRALDFRLSLGPLSYNLAARFRRT